MKIVIVERIATWILSRNSEFVARVRDPFAARSRIYKLPTAMVCDVAALPVISSKAIYTGQTGRKELEMSETTSPRLNKQRYPRIVESTALSS
jgi:hypothetical protein